MSILSKLFGGGRKEQAASEATGVEYNGFTIFPDPIPEAGQFRIAARIEMDVDGETRTHRMIRADMTADRQAAEDASLRKAKQMLDEQGSAIFARS